jgi:hypothetical protein
MMMMKERERERERERGSTVVGRNLGWGSLRNGRKCTGNGGGQSGGALPSVLSAIPVHSFRVSVVVMVVLLLLLVVVRK